MSEKELTQEDLNALAQEAVEANEAEAEASAQEETEEASAPAISVIIIEFEGPASTNSRMIVQGQATPEQLGLAGMRLLNQAWSIWSSPMVEMIVSQTVGTMFKQIQEQAQEEQVRRILQSTRGGRPS